MKPPSGCGGGRQPWDAEDDPPPGRKPSSALVATVVEARWPAAANACFKLPMIRPRTRFGSRKRTSVLVGCTFTSTSRVEVEIERRCRMPVARQEVGVGGAQCAVQQAVAHGTAVHEQILVRRVAARIGRHAAPARQPHALARPRSRRGSHSPRTRGRVRRTAATAARRDLRFRPAVAASCGHRDRARTRPPRAPSPDESFTSSVMASDSTARIS